MKREMDFYSDEWIVKSLGKLISDRKLNEADQDKLFDKLPEMLKTVIPTMASDLLKSLKQNSHVMLTEHRCLSNEFISRLEMRWFEAFDLFEMIIVGLSEHGENFLKSDKIKKVNGIKYLLEVLTRFHVRGVRISREILCLIKNGFADGAFSRWRSLHELSVLSFFIAKHGEDTAKRYVDYEMIDMYFSAIAYNKHAKKLGQKAFSATELQRLSDKKNELTKKYSNKFAKKYGWTTHILPKGKYNFSGIEESIGLDYLRPYYKWSSDSIHSSAKGIFNDMGITSGKRGVLVAGSTNYGFTDPAQNTAKSLFYLTGC